MAKNRKISKTTIKNQKYLLEHFRPEYIENMTDPKEYVVGFGSNNKSFCYLVEVGTKEIGDIRGANSSKFGLWYGTNGKDKEKKYRATKQHFGGDVDRAFKEIKVALASLIRETKTLAEFKDIDSIFSSMFKYKIMYLYNSKIMLPIFQLDDLQHFEDCLDLPISKTYEEAQKALLKYKAENSPQDDNHHFMNGLYSKYGKGSVSNIRELNEEADYQLNKAVMATKPPKNWEAGPVPKAKLKNCGERGSYYPRDPEVSSYALNKANHQCEIDPSHPCFLRRSDNSPYTEPHHLIPLAYHYKFGVSLDVPANIISLCSGCHNEIHYGKDADVLIEKLFRERKEKLREAGIDIELEQLLEMYHRIGNPK